jgi:hypothetical protein
VVKVLYSETAKGFFRVDEYEREVPREPGTRLAIDDRARERPAKQRMVEGNEAPTEQQRERTSVAERLPVAASWFKRLSASDAQHPPREDSNPTGKLRLTQAGLGIDQTTFFRRELFGAANWRGVAMDRGQMDVADVTFDEVVIDGVNHGPLTLRIDHADWREAGQGNVTTVLAWGPTLGALLRQENYTDHYVVMSQSGDGTLRLEITPDAPTRLAGRDARQAQ